MLLSITGGCSILRLNLKLEKKFQVILAIIIIIILLFSGVYAYIQYFFITKETLEIPEKQIDDRISPLTNQAIFLEIHRIRKKGIIDVMENSGSNIIEKLPIQNKDIRMILDGMRPGRGWDNKPSYYYTAVLDGYEWIGRQIYNQWDTGYMNQGIFRNVEEEQETTEVKLSIIENIQQKRLIRDIITKETKDTLTVIYDFRTGRWMGDDSFNDSDGYGHYNGSHYEIWFSLYQTSADNDVIPWWVETNVLGTDPQVDDTRMDPDGDGIPTEWEWRWGYDPFVKDNHTTLDPDNDGLQNIEEYIVEDWLANPFSKEIYLEVDYMEKTPKQGLFGRDGWDGWTHVFYKESQQMLIERFNDHGITVHIDDGRMGGGGDLLPFGRGSGAYQQETGVVGGFYNNNFDDERKGIFRYIVIAYGGGWCHPQDSNHFYDCICVPHNRNFFINQLDFAITERTKRIGQAVQILHELGHSLGMLLEHCGGVDNSSSRAGNPPDYPWFDYVSVMNYDYFRQRIFDYSDGSHGEHDCNDWAAIDLSFFQRPSEEMEGIGSDY